ncbi:hypothetical protein BKA66DRAFT_566245 [Pyrenochaeta sp. MPI-SDFR-AT-0127]|nr:hypothetical protein BKA66DRAFT_566245 [Pyrenochaeta sp. MPI-SDFR-AT-0127]
MEALGASLAVASLTIQLVDGVGRFQTFFEECRDPTINIQDLLGQLHAVRQLLDTIDKKATRPGVDSELAGATSLKDELGRSKSKLQELTNLVMKFEAGLSPTPADRSRGKIRVKNYLKLHAQQKKIRRYAEKLDRTRATVLDHFHITIMEKVSDIQSTVHSANIQQIEYQQALFRCETIRSIPSPQPLAIDSTRKTTEAQYTSMASNEININHKAGPALVNASNSQTVKCSRPGGSNVMFKQSIGRKSKKTVQSAPDQSESQHQDEIPNEQQTPPSQASQQARMQHGQTHVEYRLTMTVTSTEGAVYNNNNTQEVDIGSGENAMFDQHISGDED